MILESKKDTNNKCCQHESWFVGTYRDLNIDSLIPASSYTSRKTDFNRLPKIREERERKIPGKCHKKEVYWRGIEAATSDAC